MFPVLFLFLRQGNVWQVECDAIVNAAEEYYNDCRNPVSEAIFRTAGPSLEMEVRLQLAQLHLVCFAHKERVAKIYFASTRSLPLALRCTHTYAVFLTLLSLCFLPLALRLTRAMCFRFLCV